MDDVTLASAIAWARSQAMIWRDRWRDRPASDEPARSYMAANYEMLAEAADATRGIVELYALSQKQKT